MSNKISAYYPAILFWLFLCCVPLQGAEAAEENQAIAILTRTSEYLATTAQFSFSAEISFDVVQDNGQKIEYGARQDIIIERPNHARIDMVRRDGSNDTIAYDGKQIILFNSKEKVYALEHFNGNLDEAFGFLTDQLNIPVPLEDFLSTSAAEILTSKLESGFVVGTSIINSVVCDHLAFQNDTVDFQVWVSQGAKPLPQRLVINYRNQPGKPKFTANIVLWNVTPMIVKELFSFTPPGDMERIPIKVIEPPLDNEGGKQ